jgi:hypothetical protein
MSVSIVSGSPHINHSYGDHEIKGGAQIVLSLFEQDNKST